MQAFAHAWQWSWSCFWHSVPQASHTTAQRAQLCFINACPFASPLQPTRTCRPHSLSSRIQPLKSWWACSFRQRLKQVLQALIQPRTPQGKLLHLVSSFIPPKTLYFPEHKNENKLMYIYPKRVYRLKGYHVIQKPDGMVLFISCSAGKNAFCL